MTLSIEWRTLRYFEVIAELQHLGKAAARLHRSQPALSAAVRGLEQACGAPLFERVGRGIRLTPAGEVLLKWARRVRVDWEDAGREVAGIGQGLSGHIRVGIVPTAAQFLMPAAMLRLLGEAPAVTLKTVVSSVDMLVPMLRAGEIDVAIGSEQLEEVGLTAVVVADDQIVVACSAQHEILSRKARLEDLARYRWMLQPVGSPTRDWLDNTFLRRNLPRPNVQVESNTLLPMLPLIAHSDMLSFISRRNLRPDTLGALLREVPLPATTWRRRFVAIQRAGSYLPPAVERFISHLTRLGGERRRAATAN